MTMLLFQKAPLQKVQAIAVSHQSMKILWFKNTTIKLGDLTMTQLLQQKHHHH